MTLTATVGSSCSMWPYYPDLLETPVPRYTSFPTAAEFEAMGTDVYANALEGVQGDVSLYVHVPFCEKICFYCGCNTGVAGRRDRLRSYIDALHREIALVSSLLPQDVAVKRVSFGGGSPNAMAPIDFVRLVDSLTVHFRLVDPVLSIELDPRAMTEDWAAVIGSVGIERASLGVQTFARHCQEAIGRVQPEEMITRTVDRLRTAGVASLNFDLMYGLPSQSMEDLLETLRETCALGADRVALFGYAHVPHLIPRQRVIDAGTLPNQADRFAMAAHGHDYLCVNGYTPVGFDHFARRHSDPLAVAAETGSLRRNFQGFTDDAASNVIGLGSSAISSFPSLLAQNEKNSGRYRMITSQNKLATERGIERSVEDQVRGSMIENFLCTGQASVTASIAAEIALGLDRFIDRGLVVFDGKRIVLQPGGVPYARTIAALLDPYRRHSTRRFSSAV